MPRRHVRRLVTVGANMCDSQPDLFRMDSPAHCHARVARHIRVASANEIRAAPARQQLSALDLLLPDDFTRHVAMIDLLRRTRQGAGIANICCTSIPCSSYQGMKVLVRWDMAVEHQHVVKEKVVEVKNTRCLTVYICNFPER